MKEKFIAFVLFFFGVYYYSLTSFSEGVNFLDEIFSILFFPYLVSKLFLFKKIKRLNLLLLLLILIFVIGIAGSLVYEYQSLLLSFKGGFVYVKSYIPFFFVVIFCVCENLKVGYLNRYITRHFVFSVLLVFLGVIYQIFFRPEGIYWKGPFPQFVSFYSPDTRYGDVVSFLGLVYFYLHSYSKKKNRLFFYGVALLIVVSFRVKALFFLVILVLYYYSNKRLFSPKLLLILPLIFSFFFIKPIRELVILKLQNSYVENSTKSGDTAARAALTFTSLRVAQDHYPLGSGFATYGTHYSKESYSPIYRKYRISKIYGLSKSFNSFVSDTQWPAILGELGFIGLVIYIIMFYVFFDIVKQNIANTFEKKRVLYLAFVLLLTQSLGAPILFNASSSAIFVLLAILTMKHKVYKR